MKTSPLRRKTPLRAKTALRPSGPLLKPKKNRTKKAWTAAKYRKEAIELAKKIVRDSSGGICAKCRQTKAVQGSHVYSVGAHSDMGAMVENILPMCFSCHHYWWHGNPMDAFAWFEREYPDRYERLSTRAQVTEKVDWEATYEELKLLAKGA